jgi:hypothetical protein
MHDVMMMHKRKTQEKSNKGATLDRYKLHGELVTPSTTERHPNVSPSIERAIAIHIFFPTPNQIQNPAATTRTQQDIDCELPTQDS